MQLVTQVPVHRGKHAETSRELIRVLNSATKSHELQYGIVIFFFQLCSFWPGKASSLEPTGILYSSESTKGQFTRYCHIYVKNPFGQHHEHNSRMRFTYMCPG